MKILYSFSYLTNYKSCFFFVKFAFFEIHQKGIFITLWQSFVLTHRGLAKNQMGIDIGHSLAGDPFTQSPDAVFETLDVVELWSLLA